MDRLKEFKNMGVSRNIMESLKKKGFEKPTDIQKEIIPILLNKETDVIGQAKTGTGKTAAFGIPLIEKIQERKRSVKAIVLTPTRELAIQVTRELNSLKNRKKLNIIPIYGGVSIYNQINRLKDKIDIVVGTPGRILDHLDRKTLKLEDVEYVVLDEADEMLDMGFFEDVQKILSHTSPERKTWMFSATLPDAIYAMAKRYMKEYEEVRIKAEELTTSLTDEIYFEVMEYNKFDALCRIIDIEDDFYGIVFCRTKIRVDEVGKKLAELGYKAESIHGDITQHMRERILNKFKRKAINILVATDVAARGIDIKNLTHVINYSTPQDPESYVHRIGRTGRAGKKGTAITFVTPEEYKELIYIKNITNTTIKKESIPDVNQIMDKKREELVESIAQNIKEKRHEKMLEISKQLLENADPQEIVASLIYHYAQEDFDKDLYRDIERVNIDKTGKTRLFVTLGREHGVNASGIEEYVKKESGLEKINLKGCKIFDKFSFITVPFEEGELILRAFKKRKKGRKFIVERAKERKDKVKDTNNKR